MINTLFENKYKSPITLRECTLFIGLAHFDINEAIFFKEEKTVRVNRIDSSWIGESIKLGSYYKGYITAEARMDLMFLFEESSDVLSLIGYTEKGSRVMLTDLNVFSTLSGGVHEFKTYTDLKWLN
ncbi:hypothetical protein C6370_20430 [Bacillus atrophaeus]|uniref:hypothetical protein n=1 Tax=Bacillus TaxID=1386 RepID=UPI000D081834|nr:MULTISPECIES: hypothetical protein [Bacillus]MCI3198082.1 hypothetical protein [Bacillus sp. HU-1818]PSA89330.1 hypothetical protein C6370_20430 [Bacillus atrophaeus]